MNLFANMTMNPGPRREPDWLDTVLESSCCSWFLLVAFVVLLIVAILSDFRGENG